MTWRHTREGALGSGCAVCADRTTQTWRATECHTPIPDPTSPCAVCSTPGGWEMTHRSPASLSGVALHDPVPTLCAACHHPIEAPR